MKEEFRKKKQTITGKYCSIILGITMCVIFTSCFSPESDGKKAVEKLCDCDNEFTENLGKETRNFIGNFADYGFKTRVEAREKSEELIGKAEHEYMNCIQKAQEQYVKLKGKYAGNYEDATKFEHAYNARRDVYEQEIGNGIPNQMEINDLILTIIPPKPDTEKIKRDLVGRKITEQPDGYHRKDWYWEIKDGDIKEIQIISENKQGEEYLYEVRLILQADGGAHEALANITYALRQNDDWMIDFLESKQVNIVKTGKYNNCITLQRKGRSGEYELELTNHCDVALVIGGVILSEFGNEWKKFSTVVDASAANSIGGLFSISVRDYQIYFVERP
jgi:hypothetical protein